MHLLKCCILIVLLCLPSCSTRKEMPFIKQMQVCPNRTLADWQPGKAEAEAQKDLAAGTPKIYYTGTLVVSPAGLTGDQYERVKKLPRADAGIGYLIKDQALHRAQFQYARRYNLYIIQHLPKN